MREVGDIIVDIAGHPAKPSGVSHLLLPVKSVPLNKQEALKSRQIEIYVFPRAFIIYTLKVYIIRIDKETCGKHREATDCNSAFFVPKAPKKNIKYNIKEHGSAFISRGVWGSKPVFSKRFFGRVIPLDAWKAHRRLSLKG